MTFFLIYFFQFFNVVSYVIGGHVFSLNEIENGILRSNRKPIGSLRKPFSRNDPRLSIALEKPEPRVHFALVCGAKSCPPIKTYSSKVSFRRHRFPLSYQVCSLAYCCRN